MLRNLVAISLVASASGVAAQEADESALDALDKIGVTAAQSVREPAGAAELRAAIRRISYNSNDADALADAGNASLILGDANAALNFLTRANTLRPNNGRTVAALASATVRTENPFEALRLFDDAVRLGISDRTIAADRALAFDLLGNFSRAQQDYKLARTAASSDDLVIRQAISLSLAGQKADADAMLVPLLQQNNPSAWRARAFMLAARGDFRESTKVTQGFMDAGSAQRMERYLRLMPDLTAAQQAAAIHLGHFPASQYVGRDSDQLRRVASAIPPVEPSPGESRLIPSGAPLGPTKAKPASVKPEKKRETARDRKTRERTEVKIAAAPISDAIKPSVINPVRTGIRPAVSVPRETKVSINSAADVATLPPAPVKSQGVPRAPSSLSVPTAEEVVAKYTSVPPKADMPPPITQTPVIPISVPTVISAGAPQVTATMTAVSIAPTPIYATATPQGPTASGEPLSVPLISAVATAAAVEPAVSAPPQMPAFDLAAIVSAIEIPESEQKPSAVPVDLKKIKAAAPKTATVEVATKSGKIDPKTAAKGKAELANPARFWVQIATGEANALTYDYRKWTKKSAELFKGQTGWTSAWGKTSRLLVGPFADMKAAKKWEGDFKKAGGDGFMWKSENGVTVTALKTK
jgi:Flp pilus assembly protein TadD